MTLRLSYLLLTLSTLLSSCKQISKPIETNISTTDSLVFFGSTKFGFFDRKENLTFTARFSECGEWGGHKERITIYSDEKRVFHARYLKYPFNCDSMPYPSYEKNIKPNVDKETTLTEKNKKSINDYLLRLTQAKIMESFPGHAGNLF